MSRIDETRDLKTSRGTLQYSTIDLIHQVEKHPVVWNRLHVDFKNGEVKQEAWNEICPNFVPFYNELDEDEQLAITAILKTRWRNCIQGLMNSVSLKQKNDRLFRPFKYAREMIFYLQTRGVKFSDIYDTEVIDGIEEPTIKTEVQFEDDGRSKNKKIKLADTSAAYRSPRLREKQINSADLTTPTNTQKAQQIKRTPASINTSNTSMQESNSDDNEMAEERNEEEVLNNHMEQEIVYPRADVQTTGICINESEAADQAFFDSIKPALRKMNETQKLDFQIDILQILKTFRSN